MQSRQLTEIYAIGFIKSDEATAGKAVKRARKGLRLAEQRLEQIHLTLPHAKK